jgi:hypothetical protein
MAQQEANASQSLKEAHNVWRKYPEYHDEPRFVTACKEAMEKYKTQAQSTNTTA